MAWNLSADWNTRNNEDAEPEALRKANRTVSLTPKFNSPQGPDPDAQAPDDSTEPEGQSPSAVPDDSQLMKLFKSALSQGTQYQQQMQSRWSRAYAAWNNEHAEDSKYREPRFRGRSHLFRPKTRATVRKKQAEAAAAMFSSDDAIVIGPSNPGDKKQEASAAVIRELINFRLDRSNENSGIPWFLISMGAHQNAQLTGICASKQYWEYKDVIVDYEPQMAQLAHPVTGEVLAEFPTGEPDYSKPVKKVVRDRPRVRLFAPEEIVRDPAGSWEDQAQDSSYLILKYPMTVNDAKGFIASQSASSHVRFRDIDPARIEQAAGGDSSSSSNDSSVRRARSLDGSDRYDDAAVEKAYQIVWLHEVFMRFADGEDYVFWTLADRFLISDPVKTEEAYPEQGGARPVSIGVASLEPFKIDPMSPVESWQPMQQEMNDLVNLRLDTTKQTIAPLAIVKKGRGVDIKAIQNRTTDSVAFVQDKDDITFDRPGDVGQAAYVEMEKMNADFDDVAGNFSLGSVQTNRQLGETVGGMQMMTSNANAMGEFDLRVWIETWVEPVLRQLVKLEQYYESDANVLAIAGQRAQIDRFGHSAMEDDLLTQQVTLTCNVGLGAADPMMSINKFGMATQQVSLLMQGPLGMAAQPDAIVDEIYGKAGYKRASERFFKFDGQDPASAQAQQQLQEMDMQLQDLTQQLQEAHLELKNKADEIAAKKDIAALNAETGIEKQKIAVTGQLARQEQSHEHLAAHHATQVMTDIGKAEHAHSLGMQKDNASRAFDQFQSREQMASQQSSQGDLAGTLMQGFTMLAKQIAEGQKQLADMIQQQKPPEPPPPPPSPQPTMQGAPQGALSVSDAL